MKRTGTQASKESLNCLLRAQPVLVTSCRSLSSCRPELSDLGRVPFRRLPHAAMQLRLALGLAAALRIALLGWGAYQDAHSAVPYTDVDYFVFSDAAQCLVRPAQPFCRPAQGLIAPHWLGDPYARATYRYTPLVALLLAPNEAVHPAFGKVLFAAADLAVGALLYRLLRLQAAKSAQYAARAVAAIWLLNPIIANISTRGSSESVVGLVVVATLFLAVRGRWNAAAAMFGLAVHVKIFPFMYGSSLVAALVARASGPRAAVASLLRFGVISFTCFMALNILCYLLCVPAALLLERPVLLLARARAHWRLSSFGEPFVQETFLYHLSRVDHRHNFSPYFYPYYLANSPAAAATVEAGSGALTRLQLFSRNPLAAFLPQLVLSLGLGFLFGAQDLAYAWLVQTFAFVTFNKVCTSQVSPFRICLGPRRTFCS